MIIGLSGYAQTGKDTLAQHLVDNYGFKRIAFADPIREALYALDPVLTDFPALSGIRLSWIVDKAGWESVKKESAEVRRMLQRLGTEVARDQWGNDFWVNIAMKKAAEYKDVVITDVRFPNEYNAIKFAGGKVWRVQKPDVQAVNAHASETSLDGFDFDRIINNIGTIEQMHEAIDVLMYLNK